MTIVTDVFKELFKMFVADLRLTLAILGSVALVSFLLKFTSVSPLIAGLLLVFLCLVVLAEAILREAWMRGRPKGRPKGHR
tara:strand:- start:164 stop:406 length:243 start_codon:yes stop_codon:yes gene_type:complete